MQEQEFATLMDINVAPPWRGQGLGIAISAELLRAARSNGAEVAWLSVLADNTPAIRTYARLGFETLYEYWYRIRVRLNTAGTSTVIRLTSMQQWP